MAINGQEYVMSVSVRRDKLVLKDKKKGFKKEYTLSEFDKVSDKHPEFVSMSDRFPMMPLGLTYTCLGILMLLIYSDRNVREKRLLAMITSKEKT